jgi:ribosomal protein S27E
VAGNELPQELHVAWRWKSQFRRRHGMVTTLNIKCPHCEQVSQIFLSTTVCVIILNCPSCLSPIMYFKHKIFLLDPKQLKKITGASRSTMISKLLEQIAGAETATHCSVKKSAHMQQNTAPPSAHMSKATAIDQAEKYITVDDCTNLRIELEICNDSLEFINRI